MLLVYDLLDIYYILINIRFSPSSKDNIKVVNAVIVFLEERLKNDSDCDMQYNKFLRDDISMIPDINKSIWHFGLLDSEYNINKCITDKIIVESFFIIFGSIKLLLSDEKYDEVFKLTDFAHNFPIDLLFKYNKTKKCINKFVNKLSKTENKYNQTFL